MKIQRIHHRFYGFILLFILWITAGINAHAFIPGTIQGIVSDADTQYPIGLAILKTNEGFSAISHSSGVYKIIHEPGEYTLTVQAEGYYPYSIVVNVIMMESIRQDIALTPIKNINVPSIHGDVNNNGRIGMEEALFIIQHISQ
ncbi:MAG: carboxypeptidase regulatory-like domain-containing protein [Candidatus Magnetomorum sp.]|nr:carboxypeptidase regulatory-like domain-containing protein [Candidatus Magnetomorum sp.]